MKKTALVFGASGLIGEQLVDLLLKDNRYRQVICFVRNRTGLKNENLMELEFSVDEVERISEKLKGDEIFCCLGTTMKKAKTKANFQKVDLLAPLAIAEMALQNGISSYAVVSSIGANSNSSNFYLRTKGKMEDELRTCDFKKLIIVRPSLLLGKRKEKRFGEEIGVFFDRYFGFLFFGKLKKYRGIFAGHVAKAMIELMNKETSTQIVESHELKQLVGHE